MRVSLGGTMRTPRESAPIDVPVGTVQVSGPVEWFKLALCVVGDAVDPDEVSKVLGLVPSRTVRKGEPLIPNNPRRRISDVGIWELSLDTATGGATEVAAAAEVLLDMAASTPSAWCSLPRGSVVYLDAAVSLTAMSGGIWLAPSLCRALSERNIEVRFDIYDCTVPRAP